jgi:hypothetical protein
MARIRSVHPGLATDEAYMSMSLAAKAAWPLLWTECDDQGVFEWKPIVLKARIFPADNVDFEGILTEIEKLGCITRYSVEGKSYGLVRNFLRFQRPKKPKAVHPLPDSSPPVPHQFPTGGGNPPQMEDEGGRMKDEEEGSLSEPGEGDADSKTSDEVVAVISDWNDMAGEVGLPKVLRLTALRSKKIKLRLAEIGGLEGWAKLLQVIRQSPHLLGETPPKQGENPWVCDFDWILEPKNLTKVMEGKYLRRNPTNGPSNLTNQEREEIIRRLQA